MESQTGAMATETKGKKNLILFFSCIFNNKNFFMNRLFPPFMSDRCQIFPVYVPSYQVLFKIIIKKSSCRRVCS